MRGRSVGEGNFWENLRQDKNLLGLKWKWVEDKMIDHLTIS